MNIEIAKSLELVTNFHPAQTLRGRLIMMIVKTDCSNELDSIIYIIFGIS